MSKKGFRRFFSSAVSRHEHILYHSTHSIHVKISHGQIPHQLEVSGFDYFQTIKGNVPSLKTPHHHWKKIFIIFVTREKLDVCCKGRCSLYKYLRCMGKDGKNRPELHMRCSSLGKGLQGTLHFIFHLCSLCCNITFTVINCQGPNKFKVNSPFSVACYATLHPALSVGPLVRRSIRRSVLPRK